jgi:hypothetical protein
MFDINDVEAVLTESQIQYPIERYSTDDIFLRDSIMECMLKTAIAIVILDQLFL